MSVLHARDRERVEWGGFAVVDRHFHFPFGMRLCVFCLFFLHACAYITRTCAQGCGVMWVADAHGSQRTRYRSYAALTSHAVRPVRLQYTVYAMQAAPASDVTCNPARSRPVPLHEEEAGGPLLDRDTGSQAFLAFVLVQSTTLKHTLYIPSPVIPTLSVSPSYRLHLTSLQLQLKVAAVRRFHSAE